MPLLRSFFEALNSAIQLIQIEQKKFRFVVSGF